MATRVRLSPEARREQLIERGLQLFATRTLEELTIDLLSEEAGISRGLLYHYFAGKQDFHRAVVERAIAHLVEATAPRDSGDPLERLVGSITAYIGYVEANHAGYRSLVRAAFGGDPVIRALYDGARDQLTDRLFTVAAGTTAMEDFGFEDSDATRLVLNSWAAFAENLVLGWVAAGRPMTRDQLVGVLVGGLPGMLQAAAPGG